MTTPLLATKLAPPPLRPKLAQRARLIARLEEGAQRKLTLLAAPAGAGKTTLLSAWAATRPGSIAWLSLEKADADPARFLTYLVAALRAVDGTIGGGVVSALQAPQPAPPEALLTMLINDLAPLAAPCALVLDDYHVLNAPPIDQALAFLLDHAPPQLRAVIATREDPALPLARLRARAELTEIRTADLRFTLDEATAFLHDVMGLRLTVDDIARLEARTEGWIAGLQLAALALHGQADVSGFIRTFTGGHQFILDYLVGEALHQQPDHIQRFLLRTALLDRMCGPLCDAVLGEETHSGQATLEYLDRANLFIVPLDHERRWYRYHHLFADLLRQRLAQSASAPTGAGEPREATLHLRASAWYEANGDDLAAFHHAVAAQDVDLAARLVAGKGMPLQFRGALVPVLRWLEALPAETLDQRPALWVTFASALSMTGQMTATERKLQAAERALQDADMNAANRNLIGHIAAIRALIAAAEYRVADIIAQSRRALDYLSPDNLPVRTATIWKLGFAYHLQGDRPAASRAYAEASALCQASGNIIINLLATTGLGNVHEAQNRLHQAAETYQEVVRLAGEPPLPTACEALLGLGRLAYAWNDFPAAHRYADQSAALARSLENLDRLVAGHILIARLHLAEGENAKAASLLADAEQIARQQHLVARLPEIAAAQVLVLLRQGDLSDAARLAQSHDLPLSHARALLAQGDSTAALAALAPFRAQAEARDWADDRLNAHILQAIVYEALGAQDVALRSLRAALALAEPGGFIRAFVDEGRPMARLISAIAAQGIMPDYLRMLLAAFDAEARRPDATSSFHQTQPLIVPLSEREREVLVLIAQGLSNNEIGARLCLAESSVKGHNLRIFSKLQVQRRTEAVARARALGLL